MPGDLLDVVLLGVCAAFALSGYRQGFLVGVLAFAGFLGGGALGAKLSPTIAHRLLPRADAALVGLVAVFLAALAGQLVASVAGGRLRSRLTSRLLRRGDAVCGAAVSVVSVLLVSWLVATAVAHSSLALLSRQVRGSAVLTGVDRLVPDSARVWFSSFRRLLDDRGFPEVFGGLGGDRLPPVRAADPRVLSAPGVRAAAGAVVRVVGDADGCRRHLEGSGFVYSARHVLTDAHVVAGVRDPAVQVGGSGPFLPATVVRYDPHRDVAVLYVPQLAAPVLEFAGLGRPGAPAAVLGYPEDGPYRAVPARLRGAEEVRGPDIYESAEVTRQIYAVRAVVRPGNSGGPLLAPDGRVFGMVFAVAVDDPQAGYALTAAEVEPDAWRAAGALAAVSTRGCT